MFTKTANGPTATISAPPVQRWRYQWTVRVIVMAGCLSRPVGSVFPGSRARRVGWRREQGPAGSRRGLAAWEWSLAFGRASLPLPGWREARLDELDDPRGWLVVGIAWSTSGLPICQQAASP